MHFKEKKICLLPFPMLTGESNQIIEFKIGIITDSSSRKKDFDLFKEKTCQSKYVPSDRLPLLLLICCWAWVLQEWRCWGSSCFIEELQLALKLSGRHESILHCLTETCWQGMTMWEGGIYPLTTHRIVSMALNADVSWWVFFLVVAWQL